MQEQKNIGQNIKYLIHAIPKREWYIKEFLIPSMHNQGIDNDKIFVYVDKNYEGNLKSFIKSCKGLEYDCWHLQDDIIISSKFKEETEKYYADVVNGFCNIYSKENPPGYCTPETMWYSFPCIFIKKDILDEFLLWIDTEANYDETYSSWIRLNKYDDSLFKHFMLEKHHDMQVYNMAPNIINHIDYLLGGSVTNSSRKKDASSLFWNEAERLEKLVKEIEKITFNAQKITSVSIKGYNPIELPFEIEINDRDLNNERRMYYTIIKQIVDKYKELKNG